VWFVVAFRHSWLKIIFLSQYLFIAKSRAKISSVYGALLECVLSFAWLWWFSQGILSVPEIAGYE